MPHTRILIVCSRALKLAAAADFSTGRADFSSRHPRPLLEWSHSAAAHDSLQRTVRTALDRLCAEWEEPQLSVRWTYGSHGNGSVASPASPSPSSSAVGGATLAASVELIGLPGCASRLPRTARADRGTSVPWALGVVLLNGRLHAHYLGGVSCEMSMATLFPPTALSALSALDGAAGAAALGAMVGAAIGQSFLKRVAAAARRVPCESRGCDLGSCPT